VTAGGRIIVSSQDLGVLRRVAARLRGLDWQAVDEARQQPEARYADLERAAPVHDAVAEKGYPVFWRNPVAPELIDSLYAESGGNTAELMRRLDAVTGTTGLGPVWEPQAPAAPGGQVTA
jgi:hypothetical protein